MPHPFIILAKEAGCTPRQVDVLRLTIERHNQTYIAEALGGLHRSTVKEHLDAGIAKLQKYCAENDINEDTLRYWGLEPRAIALSANDGHYPVGSVAREVLQHKLGNQNYQQLDTKDKLLEEITGDDRGKVEGSHD